VPFVSDAQLKTALDKAGLPEKQATAIIDENSAARLAALRSSLTVLALIALLAMLLTFRIPKSPAASEPET
jgi:1,4-dihydroxy-2-naphthoate octaprenyltransferase